MRSNLYKKLNTKLQINCLLLLILCCLQPALAQQPGLSVVRGRVITSDSQPAFGVSIRLRPGGQGAVTDMEGFFQINKVKKGAYTVTATAVGLKPEQKTIVIEVDGEKQVDFTLAVNAEELREVVVSSRVSNREDLQVAKMPLKNLENPQVYHSVSAEIMQQQAVTNYDDAMRNIPGITRTWESTGRAGDGGAYFALRGFDAQPSLYNGLPGLVSGNLDPANVEEIQVIKGPSGTLFGGSFYSYGGLINTITKKPYQKFGGEIGYNIGSFGLNRFTADINTPLSKTEKIALRINTAYHNENTFQDAGFKKSFFIAPSLSYEVNEKLSFLFNAEILEEERAVAPVFFHSNRVDPLDFHSIEELNLNNRLSFTSNDLTIKNPRYNLQGQMLYKLSPSLTSQTVFSSGNVKSNGIYTYIWDDVAGDNWFSQYFHKEQQTTNTIDIQQNFNADFTLGKMRNRLLVGLDFFHRNVIENGSGWARARNVTPQGDVNYVDPFSGDSLAPVYLTQPSIDNILATTGASASNITNASYSAYISDVVNITPGLMVMASLRADYFDSRGEKNTDEDDFNQFALSPKFGLLYRVVPDKISLFANYMNAFINVAPMQVADPDGSNPRIKSFKPEQADQLEYGIKANLLADKLFATVSVYDIKVTNRVTGDPGNFYNYLQGGKVGSKGFEIDLNANPVSGLRLLAGYSYNRTQVISGDENDFYAQPGRAPGGQGPQNLVNFWATYTFKNGTLKDFGAGFGGNYASQYRVIDNRQTGTFDLPAYTLLNGTIFYNSGKFRISLNVNNLANTTYYTGYWSVNPQKPRNVVAGFAYKF